jgi:Fic family protein
MRFPKKPPDFWLIWAGLVKRDPKLLDGASPTLPDGRYLHWDDLRHREPPTGLTVDEWWSLQKYARTQARTLIDAMNSAHQYPVKFSFVPLPRIQKALHDLDRTNVARELLTALGNQDSVSEYRVRQLIEEAINSSVLEGAKPTTRELARQILREGRPPANRDERMIINNWRAMRRILELQTENRPLVVDDLLELHRILGEEALEVPGAEGQLRTSEDTVVVEDTDGEVWHNPPPAIGLRERLERLLKFAEDGSLDGSSAFIHPVIRAIVVHFWVGYEHPFRDGNGRMARALYYWCMLRHGYEMAEFLSISGPIDRSPKAYYMAFAYTETDAGDLTYFILHQLNVMREALDELTAHLKKRAERMAALAQTVAGFDTLNHRQRAILQHAIRHPFQSYTVEGHAESHHVHYQTARSDLNNLVERGYLEARRVGNVNRFYPSESLPHQLDHNESV